MSFFALKTPPNAGDRLGRRRLIIADSLALLTLFVITAVLAVSTNYLYQSYASHQVALANRWLERGRQALQANKPQAAIDALTSALAYSPGQRSTQIQLAEALASAGRVQEATVYFNSLLENEQGSGLIHLQLARLASRQGDETQAIDHYQKAIYGSWEGDGYVRRRSVRMEMVDYLIHQNRLDQARNELLVAYGNAPENDLSVQMEIAQAMERAQDPGSALRLYKKMLHFHPSLREALQGAGRNAFALGFYQQAKRYLTRAQEGTGGATGAEPTTEAGADAKADPKIEQERAVDAAETRDLLAEATRVLQLYPSFRLNLAERSARILSERKLAQTRLASCTQQNAAVQDKNSPALATPLAKTRALPNPLASLASHFSHPAGTPGLQAAPEPLLDPLQSLAQRWQQLPAVLSITALKKDPELAQTQLQLNYDTELITQQVCGGAEGDDALLLKIAQSPNRVEEE